MSEENGVQASVAQSQSPDGKGKGKVADGPQETRAPVDDEEESSEDEILDDEAHDEAAEEEDDGMEEIDTDNIISDGRRTRGKVVDFAKAAAETPEDEDEDEEDDEDFEEDDSMAE